MSRYACVVVVRVTTYMYVLCSDMWRLWYGHLLTSQYFAWYLLISRDQNLTNFMFWLPSCLLDGFSISRSSGFAILRCHPLEIWWAVLHSLSCLRTKEQSRGKVTVSVLRRRLSNNWARGYAGWSNSLHFSRFTWCSPKYLLRALFLGVDAKSCKSSEPSYKKSANVHVLINSKGRHGLRVAGFSRCCDFNNFSENGLFQMVVALGNAAYFTHTIWSSAQGSFVNYMGLTEKELTRLFEVA